MRRVLAFALLLGARADVITHFAQATEIGVEQLPKHKGTDKLTFFAAVRAEKDSSAHEYVLSFGQPTCDVVCTQSMNSFCSEERTLTDGWEHFALDHYPTDSDPAALYIRRTFTVAEALACAQNSTELIVTEGDLVTYTGSLVLSIWDKHQCEQTCPPFKQADTYQFSISYNKTSSLFSGLSYSLAKYEYSAEATRNIRIDGVGLLVEITTQLKASDALHSFTEMDIYQQDCVPPMRLVALTDCSESDGLVCTQRLYLLPIDADSTAYGFASGTLEIHGSFDTDDSDSFSVAVLHVEINIDSATDYGTQQRAVDVVIAVNNTPYINTPEQLPLIDNQYLCIAIASPTLTPLSLAAIKLCTGACDGSSRSLDIFRAATNVNLGVLTQPEGKTNEASYCFNLRKIENATHTIAVEYASLLNQDSSSNSGIVKLQRRSMFDNSIATTESFWIDCPHGFHWDDSADACVHDHGESELTTWEWVFLVLLGLTVVGVIVCMCWSGSGCYDNGAGDMVHPYYVRCVVPNPHRPGHYMHAFREQHSGKIITNIQIDGDGNEVTVLDRTPVHRRRHKHK